MFKIGDFSKLSQVSSKALRHYHDTNLFKPAHVDKVTGYRFYSVEQLPRLNRIVALKELGFSLVQIANLLEENISTEQLQGMLRLRQAEIERQMATGQQQILRVQARLQQILQADAEPIYDVITKQVKPILIASICERIPDYGHIGNLFAALSSYLGEKQIPANGPHFARYHDPEYRQHDPQVEVGIEVEITGKDTERVKFSTLPAVCVATTIHTGGYDTVGSAYRALMTWIDFNEYDISIPNQDIFLRGPGPNRSPHDYITEVQFPIAKRTTLSD